jgi:hypothetical protein
MHYSDGDATEDMIGFVENSELPQNNSPIIVCIVGGIRYWADSPETGPHDFGARLGVTFLFPRDGRSKQEK